jgi:hypothetical protein
MKLVRLSILGLATLATVSATAFADGGAPRRPTVKKASPPSDPRPQVVTPPHKCPDVDLTPVMERLTAIENQLKEQDAKLDKLQSDLAACCAYQKEMLDKMWYHVERTCYAVAEIEKETSLIDTINAKLNKLVPGTTTQVMAAKPATAVPQTITRTVKERVADTSTRKWAGSVGTFDANDLPTGIKSKAGTSAQLTRTLSESKSSRILIGVNKADYTVKRGSSIVNLGRADKLDLTVPYISYQLKLGARSNQPQGLYVGGLAGVGIRTFLDGANSTSTATTFKKKTSTTPTFGAVVGYDLSPRLYLQADFLTNNDKNQRLARGIGFGLGSRF